MKIRNILYHTKTIIDLHGDNACSVYVCQWQSARHFPNAHNYNFDLYRISVQLFEVMRRTFSWGLWAGEGVGVI